MILKSISRKKDVGGLLRYIFKEQGDLSEEIAKLPPKARSFFVPGVQLTERDKHHLLAEMVDGRLMRELRDVFKGDVQKFIETKIERANQKEPFVIRNNMRNTRTIEGYTKRFDQQNAQRLFTHSRQNVAEHVIISWSPKDAKNITDSMLKDIGAEYCRLRPGCIIVGTKHEHGTEHKHLHLAVAGTALNNRSSRVSKEEYKNIKLKLAEYERVRYGHLLEHSRPNHGKGKEGVEKIKNDNERLTERTQLLRCLDEAYITARSKEDFLARVEASGHKIYHRNGRIQGVVYNGDQRKYRMSYLGYTEKLKAFDLQKEKEEKQLEELKALREHVRNERSKIFSRAELLREDNPMGKIEMTAKPERDIKEERQLQELQDMRESKDNDHDLDTTSDEEPDSQSDSEEEDSGETEEPNDQPLSETDDMDNSDNTE